MKNLLLIVFLFFSIQVMAQKVENDNINTLKYYTHLNIGFNFNQGNEELDESFTGGVGMRYSMGYKFNKRLQVGAGAGFEFYDFYTPTAFVPVFAEIRGEIMPWKIAPIYSIEVGYGFLMPTRFNRWDNKPSGAYFRPSIGWKFKKGESFATSISVGYLLQHAKYLDDNSWRDYTSINEITRNLQRYSIQFGFEF